MGVYLVNMDTGMKEDHFLGEKEVIQEQIFGNDIPYIYGEINKPLIIELTLSPLEGLWTTELRSKIGRWLDCGKFAELYSVDDINKRYFAKLTGNSSLHTNSMRQGYVTVQFQNIAPYAFSPSYELIWDESENTGTSTRTFINAGDARLYPEMHIEKIGNGDIELKNLNDSGRVFKFENLLDGEEVYVDNYNRQIKTSLANEYRYDSFNKNYFSAVYGHNTIEVTGKAKIKFIYRNIIKG